MPRLVLTVIGDDRAGLVSALADVVTAHDGNWEDSQLAELAGKFAGIVVVGVPAERVDELTAALRELDGLLEVTSHPGAEADGVADDADAQRLTLDLLGNDSPGIVREVSSVLSRHELSIETMTTGTREAPMAGGLLFEAHVVVRVPGGSDSAALRADLERLATELLVDIALA
ncbi:glycine cleavage system protein R [Terrabacter sp. Root181]|uniref:glycine cleavage system protein R n=1 Tax=Terrabacter sp. Root181 TaxID=1736484 RepID=UPI0006F3FDEF|nr:ACT domain-containing protein [Terrabacter sp. Root181]KRB47094.1 amino acid-binding ACT protein [Terrabacter sp. Root181]